MDCSQDENNPNLNFEQLDEGEKGSQFEEKYRSIHDEIDYAIKEGRDDFKK